MELLRRFSDLMAAPTMETNADVDCAICLEPLPMVSFLRLETSTFSLDICFDIHLLSSPCEHLTCENCFSRLLKSMTAEGTVPCPSCRKPCASDSFQRVQHTESERWDELLKVATEWTELDSPELDEEGLGEDTEDNVQEDSRSLDISCS